MFFEITGRSLAVVVAETERLFGNADRIRIQFSVAVDVVVNAKNILPGFEPYMTYGFVSRRRQFDVSIRNVFAKTFSRIMDAYNNRSRIFFFMPATTISVSQSTSPFAVWEYDEPKIIIQKNKVSIFFILPPNYCAA